MTDYDVVVVGGGPVGETLLSLLGHRGISAVGFEKDSEVWPKPRAVHFDAEILRTFQSIGLGEAVAQLCEPMVDYRMENEAGEVLFDIPTGDLSAQGWIADTMFHQPHLDELLRSEIQALPTVELRTGHQVEEITQDAEQVLCRVRGPDGDLQRHTARYLIGCDGARSQVRPLIGGSYERLGPDNPWLVVDGLLPGEAPVEGPMVFFGHHSRPRLWARMPGGRARMEFKVLPGDDLQEIVTPEAIERMSQGLLRPETFQIQRSAVYTFRSKLADKWRDGRLFIAGDAAHLSPPLFGQGLCSGIRDAANLAWKLDYVLSGAEEDLLDTYQSERSDHVRSWIVQATEMSGFVQTTDPQVAAQRDAFIRSHPDAAVAPDPSLGPGVHGQAPAPAGRLSIQPALPDGTRFDEKIGPHFALAARAELLTGLDPQLRARLQSAEGIVVLTEDRPGVEDLLTSVTSTSVVLRPDRYILGAADTADDLTALCETALQITQPADTPVTAPSGRGV
ncbi:bifunctional 3-(3-hydroxy-phenyl)propionate/3-hydroxycinnamic acid hydroxylase [Kocuria rosea]|uniref:bifunctional 3-(3-hydroxy-phenyl)propionate/3-hydroxycinnamic acid hydroxylase n=1 Tax=Kocuria rosea TaxID=1275 RepID=UPI00254005F0|nr:bifunctional 3-(3-hydroxy-phenyl)propionate/3-hydroxycinnamic acid hydroxylase [Kocuria rosea]WIG15849.1 bifunctional 3-(3-hydroxy-phenyl)propionate/3-hydroxycinnamic acid hydroxylase [Kocuria rosea]